VKKTFLFKILAKNDPIFSDPFQIFAKLSAILPGPARPPRDPATVARSSSAPPSSCQFGVDVTKTFLFVPDGRGMISQ